MGKQEEPSRDEDRVRNVGGRPILYHGTLS